MKTKQTFLVACMMAIGASVCQAQSTGIPIPKENVKGLVKLNFDGLFEGRYQFGYERIVGKFTSVQFNAGFIFNFEQMQSGDGAFELDNRGIGFVVAPEVRVYLSEFTNHNPPVGFYLGGFGRVRNMNESRFDASQYSSYESDRETFTAGIGVLLGFQYYTSFGVGIDVNIGPEFRYRSEQFGESYLSPFWPESDYSSNTKTRIQETVPYGSVNFVYAF